MLFKGSSITVRTLGRQDLIATKFYSYCMRNLQTDRDDLVDLKPVKDELNFAKQWILSLNDSPEREFVNTCLKEILKLTKKS